MGQELSRFAKIVLHKGVEIIVCDFSGLIGRELLEAMKENTKGITSKVAATKDGLMVSLYNDCELDEDSMAYMRKIMKAMDGFFVASATVGMTEIQKYSISIPGSLIKRSYKSKFFDSQVEAMDWTVEEYNKFKGSPRYESF